MEPQSLSPSVLRCVFLWEEAFAYSSCFTSLWTHDVSCSWYDIFFPPHESVCSVCKKWQHLHMTTSISAICGKDSGTRDQKSHVNDACVNFKLKCRPCVCRSWWMSGLSDWLFLDFLALLHSKIGSFGCPLLSLYHTGQTQQGVQTNFALERANERPLPPPSNHSQPPF